MDDNRTTRLEFNERQTSDESYIGTVIELLANYQSKSDNGHDAYTYIDGIKLIF